MDMRVLFASTQSTGHFAPLIPFAQACRDAGHEAVSYTHLTLPTTPYV